MEIQATYVAWGSIAREKGTKKENWLNLSSVQLPPTCLTRSEPWWAQNTDRWRKNAFELWKLYCSLPPTLLWSYVCVVRDLTGERAVTMSSCWGNPVSIYLGPSLKKAQQLNSRQRLTHTSLLSWLVQRAQNRADNLLQTILSFLRWGVAFTLVRLDMQVATSSQEHQILLLAIFTEWAQTCMPLCASADMARCTQS